MFGSLTAVAAAFDDLLPTVPCSNDEMGRIASAQRLNASEDRFLPPGHQDIHEEASVKIGAR
jgi:hypothetical protein